MAGGFFVQLDDLVEITPEMVVKVKNYSWNVTGGPKLAEVEVSKGDVWALLRWLGKRIEIRNSNQRRVWWGYVEEVFVDDGATSYGLSLRLMFNRVRVAYVYEVFGAPQSGLTEWAVNQASIDSFGFIKEREAVQEVNASAAMANAHRDNILAAVGRPVPVTRSGSRGDDGLKATVYCAGDIYSFGWKLYNQPAGLEANQAESGSDQVIGQGFTSTAIGMVPSGKISAIFGQFLDFTSGSQIRISNSRFNDGIYTIASVDSRPPIAQDMNVAGWNFESADDIKSNPATSDFDVDSFMETDDYIWINNGPVNGGNRGFFRIRETGEDAVVVINKTIANESPPAGSLLYRGNYITTEEPLNREFPLNSITITALGTRVAQKVQNGTGSAWTLNAIEVPIRRVGNPTDSMRMLWMADNGGIPGTVIEHADLLGETIGEATGNSELFQFGNVTQFQPGNSYWVHFQRTGADDAANFYIAEVDEEMGYPSGNLFLWNEAGWVSRTPDAHLVFRILGAVETTKQIEALVGLSGQLVKEIDVRVTTVTNSNQYRDGSTYALDELNGLLEAGRTASGRRILATCTPERILRITEQPIETAKEFIYNREGEFLHWTQTELEEGVLPVGQWIYMSDIPPVVADTFRFSPKFLEEAEYDCESGEIRPTWQGEKNVWEAME